MSDREIEMDLEVAGEKGPNGVQFQVCPIRNLQFGPSSRKWTSVRNVQGEEVIASIFELLNTEDLYDHGLSFLKSQSSCLRNTDDIRSHETQI